jgi:hypothetical protein
MTDQPYPTLQQEMLEVVANLESREWIQGKESRDDGAVCAHGAVMTCQKLRPGDRYVIRAVMRTKGVTEDWNDTRGRTKEEVTARMALIGMTNDDLSATFGPSWALVISVIRRAATLSVEELERLDAAGDAGDAAWNAAWNAARGAAGAAAWNAAWNAAQDAAWDAARDAARDTARGAARDTARDTARGAAQDAAGAASLTDLVGQHGLTQQHVDTLMAPWIHVLGADWNAPST